MAPALVIVLAVARTSGPWYAGDLALLAAHFWLLFALILAGPFAALAIVSALRRRAPSLAETSAVAVATLFALFWYERVKPWALWTSRYRPSAVDAGALAGVAVLTLLIGLSVRAAGPSFRAVATRAAGAIAIGSALLAAYPLALAPSLNRTESARRLALGSRAAEVDRPTASRRLLFIGVDGLDWAVIERLIAQQRLPQIEGLVKGGRSYELDAGDLALSPEIWTTIYTGRVPEFSGFVTWDFRGVSRSIDALPANAHRSMWGVNKWLWRATALGLWAPASLTTARLTGPAFWRIASAAGLRVAVFEPVPFTVLGEEVNGVFGWQEGDEYLAHWKTAERAPLTERFPFPGQYRETAVESLEVERRRAAIAGELVVRSPIALAVYYTPVVDETAHWNWRDESTIAAAYEQVDRSIGVLRERFGAPHAVILASDHGWEFNTYEHSRVPHGMLVVADGRVSGFGGTMRAEEVAPTVLSLLALPAPDYSAIAPAFLAPHAGRADDAARERLKALGYIGR